MGGGTLMVGRVPLLKVPRVVSQDGALVGANVLSGTIPPAAE
jgi:hypothetical protein